MIDFGRIFTAKLPYKHADWNNSDIHDTHMKSTPTDWFFPKDFTNDNIYHSLDYNDGHVNITSRTIQNIFEQIKTILSAVSKLLSKTVSLYDNVKNGFNIFGIDLTIKDDFTVVLIECNAEGTYKSKEPTTHTIIENIMFNWVNDVILKPCLRELQVNTNTKNYKKDKKHEKHKTMKKTM